LETVTAMLVEATLPAPSRAWALRVCDPFATVVVFQVAV
jgi:hypothetical protein